MLYLIIEKMTFIKLLVFLTFLWVSFFFDRKKAIHRLVFLIVTISFINETIATILILNAKSIALNTTLYTIAHHTLWLVILMKSFNRNLSIQVVLGGFVLFSLVNIFFIQGFEKFNTYTFILGALAYVCLFIYNSYKMLRQEMLLFFKSNLYILLFSPVLFFLGLSMILGFNNRELLVFKLFNKILYNYFSYFVNTIYYSLVALYIYKEHQQKNV